MNRDDESIPGEATREYEPSEAEHAEHAAMAAEGYRTDPGSDVAGPIEARDEADPTFIDDDTNRFDSTSPEPKANERP